MNIIYRRENGRVVEFTVNGIAQPVINEPVTPIPRKEWPLVLRPVKLMAKRGDRGAGDVVARVIGPFGGDSFKMWYKSIFGKDCGCAHRQEAWNARWPL